MAKDNMTPTESPFSFKSSNNVVAPGQGAPTASPTSGGGYSGAGRDSADDGSSPFAPPSAKEQDPGAAYGYRKSVFGHKDEVSVYTEQMDARHAMDKRVRTIVILFVLAVVLVFACTVLPKGLVGPGIQFSLARCIESFSANLGGFVNWVSGGPVTTGVSIVFWQTLAVAVVGAALALNGCVYQGALRNALAAPSTLGVMSGASLGTIVYALCFAVPESAQVFTIVRASEVESQLESLDFASYIWATQGRALFSLIGCFVVVGLILAISHIAGRGKVSKVALLIAGQVFTALITGVIAVIRTYVMYYGTEEQLDAISSVVGGGVSDITDPVTFLVLAVPLFIGMAVIFALRQRMNLLAFGDEEVKTMGVNTMLFRNAVIVICTALTGIVVSFVGSVGFVGFLVPHLARKMVGPNLRYLVPASALLGAVYLLIANYVMYATSIFAGSLGTLTSLIGAVFFLVMAVRERARGNVDWI